MSLRAVCGAVLATTLALLACKSSDGPRREIWEGPTDMTIESVHGVVDCPETIMLGSLRVRGLPVELHETRGGVTTAFVGVNPFQLAGSGARPTEYTQGSLELWRWTPRDSTTYGYVVITDDGTDPVIYSPCPRE